MKRMDELTTNRELRPRDDLSDILETLEGGKSGIKEPLLVREDGLIIDGVRRYNAAKKIGYTGTVPVEVAYDFVDALEYFKQSMKNNGVERIPPSRVFRLYEDLRPLSEKFAKEARSVLTKGATRRQVKNPNASYRGFTTWGSREIFNQVLGLKKHILGDYVDFMNLEPLLTHRRDVDEFAYLQEAVERGMHSPSGAKAKLLRIPRIREAYDAHLESRWNAPKSAPTIHPVPMSLREQKAILHRAVSGLEGTVRGLSEMGMIQFPLEVDHDLNSLVERFHQIKIAIGRVDQALRQGRERQKDEGTR